MLLSMHLGNYRGKKIVSKPMFLVAIINEINEHILLQNKIKYTDNYLRSDFENIYKHYYNTDKITLSTFLHPYYHLASSPFYHLVWKDHITQPPMANLPSIQFIKDNLLFAQFDNNLWEILQDEKCRNYLKQCLVNEYLNDY